jgi:putative endonuclease
LKAKKQSPHNLAVGRWGENLAADFLRQKGYRILSLNVRTPFGEIDLIAQQGNTFVFIEVKTRANGAFGLPEEAITPKKRQNMIEAAQYYLNEHPEIQEDCRIDVIAIRGRKANPDVEIVQYENAIFWD